MPEEQQEEGPLVWGHSSYPDEGFTGAYASKEEAIKEGRQEYGEEVEFYILAGRFEDVAKLAPNEESFVETVIETIGENSYEVFGELAEEWPQVSVEAEDVLRVRLNTVIKDWMREFLKKPPGWSPVGEQETVPALVVEDA